MTAQPGTSGVVQPQIVCPKCGADESPVTALDEFAGFWVCGSYPDKLGIRQSDKCRIRELEAQLAQANADRQALLTAGCIALIPAAMFAGYAQH